MEFEGDDAKLVEKQYSDRKKLRPVLDEILETVQERHPDVRIKVRDKDVQLFTPERQFAVVVPSTKSRVDIGFRMDGIDPQGRLKDAKDLGNEDINLKIGVDSVETMDEEVTSLLTNAWNRNL
ncbi:MAG: DUF5655 domain-containing protein [Nitriliruptorales bacterium]|nr:DUF5655 domain-containing protein [Nitriliruptorales bacterium]MDX1657811.1 DUF5655 domain-containing protein [Nitriliruptorales bacterium]